MNIINIFKKQLEPILSPLLKPVGSFKNIHKGEVCYLFGDGISLKWFDLSNFKDKISITVGYVSFRNDYKFLNNPYSLLIEPYWFYPLVTTKAPPIKTIRNKVKECFRDSIIINKKTKYFLNVSNFPVIRKSNVYYLYRNLPNSNIVEYFLNKGINPMYGTFRSSILMSIYMGFSKVYLVGYDYTHTPGKIHHWYEKGEGLPHYNIDYEKDFIKIAEEFIEIFVVTMDSNIKSLNTQFISYEELTGAKPLYRENYEILNNNYLKALATWPGYKIF